MQENSTTLFKQWQPMRRACCASADASDGMTLKRFAAKQFRLLVRGLSKNRVVNAPMALCICVPLVPADLLAHFYASEDGSTPVIAGNFIQPDFEQNNSRAR